MNLTNLPLDTRFKPWDRWRYLGKAISTPVTEKLIAERVTKNYKTTKRFEVDVFDYLLKNKVKHGINEVFRLDNVFIDGALQLENGTTVAVEIKYSLGWANNCTARVEITRFITEEWYKKISIPIEKPSSAVIIFERFSPIWQREHPDGWSHFYEEEDSLRNKFPPIPVDIAQLTKGKLKFNPMLQ